MVDLTVDHYRIPEKLGGGGMGVVHKAENLRVGSLVAVKFLPDKVLRAAQHDQQTAAIAPRTLQARDVTSSSFLAFVLTFVAKLGTSFLKFGNVFPTPSPGPPRLVKASARPVARRRRRPGSGARRKLWAAGRATLSREGRGLEDSVPIFPSSHNPLPRGQRVRGFDSDPFVEPQPSPLAGDGARGTGVGEGLVYVSVVPTHPALRDTAQSNLSSHKESGHTSSAAKLNISCLQVLTFNFEMGNRIRK